MKKNNWKKLCLIWTILAVLFSSLSLPAFAADEALDVTSLYKNKDVDGSWSLTDAKAVDLNSLAQGETFTITEKGDYVLSGSLQGQVVIEVPEEDKVRLILNGVSITAQEGPAIYEKQADKLIITLAEGTKNVLTDGTPVTDDDDTIGAALYAEDDLSVNGTGSLIVNGTQKHGIQSKADLVIANGQITVTSVLDGVRGRNSVLVLDGTINITAGGDGVTSTRDDAEGKGWVVLAGGSVTVKTGEGAGAVQASANSQGGMNGWGGRGRWDDWGTWGTSSDQTTDSISQKAVKAATDLTVLDGTYTFDCADDGLHAVSVTVSGGTFAIQSGDDAMHADQDLTINGGTIDVAKCYEGLEGQNVNVNGGDIRVVASDDGVNASGGNDGSGFGGWGRAGGNTEMDNGGMLTIAGGHLEVTAGGDGLDSNGSILISGGVTGVCTPSSGMEGPIDFNGTGTQTGGTLIIASGSGMGGGMGRMGGMSASLSGQASMTFSCSGSAGKTITLQNESGETLGTFTPKNAYGSVTVSSASLQAGSGCTVLADGKTLYSGTMDSGTAGYGNQNNGYGNWNNNGGGNGCGGQHGRRGW